MTTPTPEEPAEYGLDAALSAGPRLHQVTIRTANVPQADLIAMRRGYTAKADAPSECGMWTWITFEPMRESP